MQPDLHGRALDEAVAKVLGTYIPLEKFPSARSPRYSTDPRTQAEKLAWLQKCEGYEWFCVTDVDDGIRASVTFCPLDDENPKEVCRSGTTIDEALCRLIIAVAESEAGR